MIPSYYRPHGKDKELQGSHKVLEPGLTPSKSASKAVLLTAPPSASQTGPQQEGAWDSKLEWPAIQEGPLTAAMLSLC